jgi:hypothetical protein
MWELYGDGFSEADIYSWKAKSSCIDVSEDKRLRTPDDRNTKQRSQCPPIALSTNANNPSAHMLRWYLLGFALFADARSMLLLLQLSLCLLFCV